MKCVISLWICQIILLVLDFLGCNGVKINSLHVPSTVKNGTDSVVLDCEYRLPNDKFGGLVIHWFLNDQQIFQWIPPKKPQALGILRDRLDLDYKISNDKYQRHRALRILQPTTALSGLYTCRVTTFEDEDSKSKNLTIFAPPKRLTMWQYITPASEVNITCRAEVVFPPPQMELFLVQEKDSRSRVDGVTVQSFRKDNGSYYDTVLSKVFFEEDLKADSVLECSVTLPDTNFSLNEVHVYFPGISTNVIEDGAYSSIGSSLLPFSPFHILCYLILFQQSFQQW